MFDKLLDEVAIHHRMTKNNCCILHDFENEKMRTIIIRNDDSGDWWIYQSSHATFDGEETNVDLIRLEKRLVDSLKVNDLVILEVSNLR